MAMAAEIPVWQKLAYLSTYANHWPFHARPSQRAPGGDWLIWLILTGRGWGKTRTAAELIRQWVNEGTCRRINLVGRTAADARDTMISGESGLMAVCQDPFNRPKYLPSRRLILWPNGSQAQAFSAEEPDALRGPQCDGYWADELATWKYLQETWDQLQFGARLGEIVRGVITTTPRPIKILKELISRPDVHVTRGHTFENRDNLAPSFLASIRARYEGTRLGRQELEGQILDDNPAALWKRANLDANRATQAPPLARVAVAVDPSATAGPDSAETGIVVGGVDQGGLGYVLEDCSLRGSPDTWAKAAVTAYHKHRANVIVYEANQGGDMVAQTLRTVDPSVPLQKVTATRGKYVRAEPVAALYEQNRVKHLGQFPDLEDQLCDWEPGAKSPDRLDALVWLFTYLMVSSGAAFELSLT